MKNSQATALQTEPAPAISISQSRIGQMKISQVAIYVPDQSVVLRNMEQVFGPLNFYSDELEMVGNMRGLLEFIPPILLGFTHLLMDGVELEYITSSGHQHWHSVMLEESKGKPFLSHLGAYVSQEDIAIMTMKMDKLGILQLQNTYSYNHTNPRGDGTERHYTDVIFDTRDFLGFNLKLSAKS
jgi:hypothetical protein